MKNFMAVDQYGQIEHNLGPYPRKALLRRYDRKHAEKMYVDAKSKGSLHIGWVIAGHWFTVYHVERMEAKLTSGKHTFKRLLLSKQYTNLRN